MHPAIGQLNGGKFYSYLHGYSAEPIVGTLEEVEIAMGLRPEPTPSPAVPVASKRKSFDVTMRFQYPAWDEVDGIVYRSIEADSKSEANAMARRMADQDGHLAGGKGRVTFSASEL
ncbi:hypothetical protein CJU35_05275 [Pseudomonas aeruginosa]|nr:hypothetical protein [Pseudomonas aeruginosa]PBV09266.1 hypothetical protein CJU35_05275 [Pseudomonas aeruginosa]